jgi:hypothetical protein
MLPKWHALLGFLFSYIAYWFTNITLLQASLIFLASFLIDIDHYIWYVLKAKDFSLKKAYVWHKKIPPLHKPIMQVFHTIEFHILVGLFGIFWNGFYYILIGFIFHSLVDITYFIIRRKISVREYSLIRFLILKKKEPNKYFKF